MLTTIFSVTSDLTTSGQQRSRWIALMEALQTISATLGKKSEMVDTLKEDGGGRGGGGETERETETDRQTEAAI